MKYICLFLCALSIFISVKFDWYVTGNEAIAATKQVLTGDDYIVGRTTQEMWATTRTAISLIGAAFGFYSAYLFKISYRKQK